MIGHAPRHLDRNIALVGCVIDGIENLSILLRGKSEPGFHDEGSRRVPIASIWLASDLPVGKRPHHQYRAADNARFTAYIRSRENRQPPFLTVPAGGADICNVPVPVRETP